MSKRTCIKKTGFSKNYIILKLFEFNLVWGCFYEMFQKTQGYLILRGGLKKTSHKKTCLYF